MGEEVAGPRSKKQAWRLTGCGGRWQGERRQVSLRDSESRGRSIAGVGEDLGLDMWAELCSRKLDI